MNVLKGILKSEMVEANVLMEHIEGMNVLLVLIWIYILPAQKDEYLSVKGDLRVI